ncbi:hypothetical protein D6C89_07647 [Aureobasidium pullulans]|nr:hypothetical protein D6C89_07647 [Aureobasidium pullulans]
MNVHVWILKENRVEVDREKRNKQVTLSSASSGAIVTEITHAGGARVRKLLSHGLRAWVKRNMLAIQNKKFEWKVATPVYSEKVEHLCSTCDVFRSRKLWWEHPNGFECHDCYTKRDWITEVSPVGLEDHKFGELRALKKSPSGEPKH